MIWGMSEEFDIEVAMSKALAPTQWFLRDTGKRFVWREFDPETYEASPEESRFYGLPQEMKSAIRFFGATAKFASRITVGVFYLEHIDVVVLVVQNFARR